MRFLERVRVVISRVEDRWSQRIIDDYKPENNPVIRQMRYKRLQSEQNEQNIRRATGNRIADALQPPSPREDT